MLSGGCGGAQEAGGECKAEKAAKPSLRSSGEAEAPAGGEGGDEPEGLSAAEVRAPPTPPGRQPRSKSQVNLPQMPLDSGGI